MDMPTTYESKTTTTTTSSSTSGPSTITVDMDYIRSIPGILKIVEIVLSLLTFICSVVVGWSSLGGGWVDFVAISAFVLTIILFLCYLFGVMGRIPIPMNIVELVYYAVYCIFYLIAASLCAARGKYHDAIAAAAFFGFAALLVFAIDLFFQYRAFREGTTITRTSTSGGTTTTTTVESREATY